ncbi:MAG: ABC transporter ATP-binding protein [Betaproteobacteria bacterium]|nr:ABC transporter ATP-binding protein [Betaproteobacteria bacterium]
MLEVEDLQAGYGAVRILHGLSLSAAKGEPCALVGANGAGKTTLMRTLCGLLPVASGRIRFAGEDITHWPSHRRVEAGLVLVPEGRLVFADLSVDDNLRLGAITPHARTRYRDRRDQMFALFPRLLERRRQAAGTLSGGEQQLLAMARGLMAHPRMLLLDEPTLGLAPVMCRQIFELIPKLVADGLSVLLAEQDVKASLSLATQAYVLENGRIALSGAAETLRGDERVRHAYMGM